MNVRLIRGLTRLYPPAWRSRYGEEFQNLLETDSPTPQTILNVVRWALYERFVSLCGLIMDRRQTSLALMLYTALASGAAGMNFYWTVNDTPLATAMHAHPALFAMWNSIRAGAFLAAVTVSLAASRFLIIVRSTPNRQKRNLLRLLTVPPLAGLLLLAWLIGATVWSGGHWVPTPWDVAGDWIAPQEWPPLSTRWWLGAVTCVLMVTGFVASALSLRAAVRLTDLSQVCPAWFGAASLVLAGSVAVMTMGVLAWGHFAEQYAGLAFHARNGGFFSSTNSASWLGSLATFLTAAVTALQGVRSALSLRTE